MHPSSPAEAAKLLDAYSSLSAAKVRIGIAAPYPYLRAVALFARSHAGFSAGVQDISIFPDTGAHTGEISARIAKASGASFSIIGHSERRQAGEKDGLIQEKLTRAIEAGITPILCVGEGKKSSAQRARAYVAKQLSLLSAAQIRKTIIAYEPIWAIGGKEVDPAYAVQVILGIKEELMKRFSVSPVVLYGGSVDCKNIDSFIYYKKDIDGYLVGSASLRPRDILQVIQKIS